MRGTVRLPLAQNAHQRSAVVILQHGGIELPALCLDDVLALIHNATEKLNLGLSDRQCRTQGTLIDTLFHKRKIRENVKPVFDARRRISNRNPRILKAVDREFGPIALDATEKEAVHRCQLAQATKILRLNQQEQIERRAHLNLGIIMSRSRWGYNSSERNQIYGIISNLRDAVRVDGVRLRITGAKV